MLGGFAKMTSKEAAKKWGCSTSTVTEYCRNGLIFGAERIRGKWDIPENAGKPPMSKGQMRKFLQNLLSLREGAEIDWNLTGYPLEKIKEVYLYLAGMGYVKNINKIEKDLTALLQNASLTTQAKEFFALEEYAKALENQTKTTASFAINTGVINGKVEREITKKN